MSVHVHMRMCVYTYIPYYPRVNYFPFYGDVCEIVFTKPKQSYLWYVCVCLYVLYGICVLRAVCVCVCVCMYVCVCVCVCVYIYIYIYIIRACVHMHMMCVRKRGYVCVHTHTHTHTNTHTQTHKQNTLTHI